MALWNLFRAFFKMICLTVNKNFIPNDNFNQSFSVFEVSLKITFFEGSQKLSMYFKIFFFYFIVLVSFSEFTVYMYLIEVCLKDK